MKAKEYLQQLQRLNTIINQKIKELEDLESMSTSINGIDYAKTRVQTSSIGDAPYTNAVNRMIDLNAEINREIDDFVRKKHLIINQIQGLQNNKYIEILYKRYVEFKRLEIVAVEMNFAYQYIIELHGYALREFQTTYENLLKTNDGI